MSQDSLMDTVDEHIGPNRPITLGEDIVFIPSSTFEPRVPFVDWNEPELTSFASQVSV